ncbi:MAG: hypothetical protein N3A00_00155 [Thermodesulfovibrio sp.]|nr:hypothetical protein [Thermodesulfovibrio sp.]
MKILELKEKLKEITSGEFIIGSELTNSHACYMIYGVLRPAEKQRLIKPGKGHEEIVLILQGEVKVTGIWEGILKEGEAFHIVEEESVFFENLSPSDTIYLIAGGHSEKGHSH